MVVGRLTHYALDLALVTTVLAGVKRNTGYTFKTKDLPEGAPQSIATSYLNIGESIFDYLSAYSYTSTYFTKQHPFENNHKSSSSSNNNHNNNNSWWGTSSSSSKP